MYIHFSCFVGIENYKTTDGFKLGSWVRDQRRGMNRNSISKWSGFSL